MEEISVLIGGKAGDGINQAGMLLARLFSQLGYFVYMYLDYPSLIRGGHNFAIIRAADKKIASHRKNVDYILAINQDTVDLHKDKLKQQDNIIYDSDTVRYKGLGLALGQIIKEEKAMPIMRNSILIGALAKVMGIDFQILEKVMEKNISKDPELNLRLAKRGYEAVAIIENIRVLENKSLPVLTGNEAIGLGLISAGLDSYVAYPMTPSSNLLHFLAKADDLFNLTVIHPESEIGAILMALGFAYQGKRAAVGTSGGGFCLMTESLSLSGMAELPVVIVMGQRPGPSTGLPTYSSQTELLFVLHAGQGEFTRFVVAPGDLEEAYYWSGMALNMAWKYQIPSIVLTDKTLSEGAFSFDKQAAGDIHKEEALMWEGQQGYKRYEYTDSGVSALAFPPHKQAVIKVNSYEHDQRGLTTEDPVIVKPMYEKRLRKEKSLAQELAGFDCVKTYGNKEAKTALLCWGSNKGICIEVAEKLGYKVIQPIVLNPFPVKQFKEAVFGVNEVMCVESNATAQLLKLVKSYGYNSYTKILKFDGRPFSVEELEEKVRLS